MLYFIRTEESIKIGISSDPTTRYRAIRTSCPTPCELILTVRCKDDYDAENKMHHALRSYRREGEWFNVSFTHALNTLMKINVIDDILQPVLLLENPVHADAEFKIYYRKFRGYMNGNKSLDEHYIKYREQRARFDSIDELITHQQSENDHISKNAISNIKNLLKD